MFHQHLPKRSPISSNFIWYTLRIPTLLLLVDLHWTTPLKVQENGIRRQVPWGKVRGGQESLRLPSRKSLE